MRVRKVNIVVFILLVVAIFGLAATTTGYIWKHVTLGLDLQGGFEVLYEAEPGQKVNTEILKDTAAALNSRINVLGVSEPDITIEPPNRIRVQLAGVKDQNKARELLGKQAKLTFRDASGKVLLEGSDLKEKGAKVDYDQMGQPVVTLQLKNADKFAKITREHLGQPIAIYLDEQQLSAPVVQQVITGGTAQITGQKDTEEAQQLADLLNAGAIPLKMKEIQSHSVDASLGEDSLRDSLIAGAYAVVAIFIFMIGFYRLPGFVAVTTLVAYSYLLLLIFMVMGVTLTLPGIAAFILGIGMAVDANIIMNERIREEMRVGKSMKASVRAGSKRSFLTIFDANITTIIAGAVLFIFGSAGVKGFSVTLIAGILVSFVTAVALSRIMMNLLVRSNLLKSPVWFRVREDEISDL